MQDNLLDEIEKDKPFNPFRLWIIFIWISFIFIGEIFNVLDIPGKNIMVMSGTGGIVSYTLISYIFHRKNKIIQIFLTISLIWIIILYLDIIFTHFLSGIYILPAIIILPIYMILLSIIYTLIFWIRKKNYQKNKLPLNPK